MKRTLAVALLLALLSSVADAGKVVAVPRAEADVKIVETTVKAEADVFVFVTTVPAEARKSPYVWMWTTHRDRPVLKVFLARSRADADLKVFYVRRASEAGPGRKTLPP